LLIRHSSILGNDDEYEQTMRPFIEKIAGMDKGKMPSHGEWAFLRDWETPIVEENLEQLSERGRKDAKVRRSRRRDSFQALGKYLRNQYRSLFPPRQKKAFEGSEPPYKVIPWSSILADNRSGPLLLRATSIPPNPSFSAPFLRTNPAQTDMATAMWCS
jgi:hypothetical protein